MKPDTRYLFACIKSIREDLGKEWKRIMVLSLLTFFIVLSLLTIFYPLQYIVKATIGVNHAGMSTLGSGWSEQKLYDNYRTAAENASRVKNVLESKGFQTAVAAELGLDYFEGSVSAVRKGESSLLEITVRTPHAGTAYKEACMIVNGSSELSSYLAYGLEICVLKEPVFPQQFEDPFQNLRGACLAALSVLLILIFETAVRSGMKDTIRSASDVALKTGLTCLGVFDSAEKTAALRCFQRLAHRILHRMDAQGDHVLLMVDTDQIGVNDGIAFNTARCMAQAGRNVVLVVHRIDEYRNFRSEEIETNYPDTRQVFESSGMCLYRTATPGLCILAPQTDILEKQQEQDFTSFQWRKIIALTQEMKDEGTLILLDVPYCGYLSDLEEASEAAEIALIVIGRHRAEACFINDMIEVVKLNSQILGGVFCDISGIGKGKEYAGKA